MTAATEARLASTMNTAAVQTLAVSAPAVQTLAVPAPAVQTPAGGGWAWILSDLKALLETGRPLAS